MKSSPYPFHLPQKLCGHLASDPAQTLICARTLSFWIASFVPQRLPVPQFSKTAVQDHIANNSALNPPFVFSSSPENGIFVKNIDIP